MPPRTRLRLLAFSALIVCFLLYVAERNSIRASRQALDAITRAAAPSVIAAERLRVWVADLDANETTRLLTDPDSSEGKDAEARVQNRRSEIASALIDLGENITLGETERASLVEFSRQLDLYLEAMANARRSAEYQDLPRETKDARAAWAIARDELMPIAERVASMKSELLTKTYESQRGATFSMLLVLLGLGLLYIVALTASNRSVLAQAERAPLNYGLLAAACFGLAALGDTIYTVSRVSHELRVATEDAFGSIQDMLQARSALYEANADENRFLLDREQAPVFAKAFEENVQRVAIAKGNTRLEEIPSKPTKHSDPVGGFIGKALASVSFSGEREAVTASLRAFVRYVAADAEMRAAERRGDHQAAVLKAVSYAPDGTNYFLEEFQQNLWNALQINIHAFEAARAQAVSTLAGSEPLLAAANLLAAAAILVGFWPRVWEDRP